MTAPARPDPIPGSYRRVTPCLTVHGAGKALEFYAAGPVHANVWTWWVAVHHNIGIGGPMHM